MKMWVLAALLAALAMVPFVLQRRNINRLRSENAQLQARVQELTAQLQKSATNAQTATKLESGASKDQLLELMRLRAEVTALRKFTNAAAGAVRAPAAAAPVPTADATLAGTPAPPALGTNGPPWSFKGYTSPNDTMATYIWAMEQGRMDLLMNTATPEGQTELQRRYVNNADSLRAEAKKVLEVRPSTTHPPTENEVYLTVTTEDPAQQVTVKDAEAAAKAGLPVGSQYTLGAQRRETTVKLQRIGNNWQYAGAVGGLIGISHQ